jgi:hypothetical protein
MNAIEQELSREEDKISEEYCIVKAKYKLLDVKKKLIEAYKDFEERRKRNKKLAGIAFFVRGNLEIDAIKSSKILETLKMEIKNVFHLTVTPRAPPNYFGQAPDSWGFHFDSQDSYSILEEITDRNLTISHIHLDESYLRNGRNQREGRWSGGTQYYEKDFDTTYLEILFV